MKELTRQVLEHAVEMYKYDLQLAQEEHKRTVTRMERLRSTITETESKIATLKEALDGD